MGMVKIGVPRGVYPSYLTVNRYCSPSMGSPSKFSGRFATGSICFPNDVSSSSLLSSLPLFRFALEEGMVTVSMLDGEGKSQGVSVAIAALDHHHRCSLERKLTFLPTTTPTKPSIISALSGEMDEDDISLENLQAQIDMSMSFAQSLVSSWVKPSKPGISRKKVDLENEMLEATRRRQR